jgi:hypothetical protein
MMAPQYIKSGGILAASSVRSLPAPMSIARPLIDSFLARQPSFVAKRMGNG